MTVSDNYYVTKDYGSYYGIVLSHGEMLIDKLNNLIYNFEGGNYDRRT